MSYGEIAVTAYETIAEYYAARLHALPVDTEDCAPGTNTIVKFLELKGYVSTTELTRSAYLVKPTNHCYAQGKGHLYCKCPEQHCPTFGSKERLDMV